MKESDKIELRSEEVQDILTRPPHFLVRSGISIISVVILVLFISTFFFKYPDVISGEVSITTENPPLWLVARTSGKIKELYCLDKEQIEKGKLIAVIENSASTRDVEKLKSELKQCIISDSVVYIPSQLQYKSFELGEMQAGYSNFVRAAIDYNDFILLSQIDQEKRALNRQIAGKSRYSSSLKEQIKIKQEDLKLAELAYEREKTLFEKGVLSKYEIEVAERNLLNIRESFQQLRSALISDEIEIVQLNQNIVKYDIQYLSEKNRLFTALKSSYQELNSLLDSWEQSYLIKSSESGTLTFNNIWSKYQFVNSGEKIFAIVPVNSGEIIGRVAIPSSGAGKIKEGQTVNIKLHSFPYMEYGFLQGEVKNMSLVPNNNNLYIVNIKLLNGLKSTIGKNIDFRGELIGQAEILTDDLSLAQRIMSPLKTLFEKYRT